MTYEIIKINTDTKEEKNYGKGYSKEDVKAMTKGHVFNGLFYERKNSKFIFIVNECL